MLGSIHGWLLAWALFCPGQDVNPADLAEPLPRPRPMIPDGVFAPGNFVIPAHPAWPPFGMGDPMYYRPSQYDKWQNYGVDLKGFFRPRVIYSPFGAYYRYNGEPYYGTPVNNLYFMPYATD